MRRFGVILLLTIVSLLPLVTPATQAASGKRCFTETGYCISGSIRDYWENNGGLAVFGYPISDQVTATVEGTWTGPIQWFERDRLEDHSAEGKGVLAGRLGARLLEMQGRPWQSSFPREQMKSGCRFFPETGFNICEPFASYWEKNGGLTRFGYPISPSITENILLNPGISPEIWTGRVQYFERRRMEYRPEYVGTPYEVLLGLLGRDIYSNEGRDASCLSIAPFMVPTWQRYGLDLGCGYSFLNGWNPVAIQPFERGAMLWVGRSDGGMGSIFTIIRTSSGGYIWRWYGDYYQEGDTIVYPSEPPPGLYAPKRGFGKLWSNDVELQKALGWATAPEKADNGYVIQFPVLNGFAWMIYRAEAGMVSIFRPDGSALEVPYVQP